LENATDRRELLTVPEAAERLGISEWMLHNLIRSRRLRTIKIGDRRLIPVTALRAFLATAEEEAA
jgi:excisionase family DNA binding protein